MGVWDKIKKVGKKVVGGIGDVAKFAAPLATFIPGVGPVAAGLIGAAGGALGKLNDKDASWGGALQSALGYGAGGYVGGLGLDKAFPGAAGQVARGGGGNIALDAVMGGARQRAGGGGVAGAAAGVGGGILDFIKQNPGLVVGGLGAAAGAMGDAQNDSFRREALDMAKASHATGAPLRDKARATLMGELGTRPKLGGVFADPGNPYSRAV